MPLNLQEIPQTVPIDVLAERLGVSPWTLRTWLRQRRLPYFKLGRRVLVRLEDVDTFLAENLHPAGPVESPKEPKGRKPRRSAQGR